MRATFLFLIFVFQFAKAQMVFENLYTSPSRFSLINLGSNEYKYYILEDFSIPNHFKLYNMNHSLFLTVNTPITYTTNSIYHIAYVSRTLFDCDSSNIEYALLFVGNGGPGYASPYFAVYRTNGFLFQKIDTVRYLLNGNPGYVTPLGLMLPIVNTPYGTKLMLCKPNLDVVVYSLCGTLPTECPVDIITNIEDFSQGKKAARNLPYPNPMEESIHLPYDIPNNGKPGKMKVYNSMGQLVKEFEIDGNFKNIILFKGDLPSGTYIYNTVHDGELSASLKFVLTD